jgi:uncharacterized membrane protein (UPF0136 family)
MVDCKQFPMKIEYKLPQSVISVIRGLVLVAILFLADWLMSSLFTTYVTAPKLATEDMKWKITWALLALEIVVGTWIFLEVHLPRRLVPPIHTSIGVMIGAFTLCMWAMFPKEGFSFFNYLWPTLFPALVTSVFVGFMCMVLISILQKISDSDLVWYFYIWLRARDYR